MVLDNLLRKVSQAIKEFEMQSSMSKIKNKSRLYLNSKITRTKAFFVSKDARV